jgi:hypothetical protein
MDPHAIDTVARKYAAALGSIAATRHTLCAPASSLRRSRTAPRLLVAKKPANNAGQPAAERVERRAGTEGNAGQQSTRRAQDRESVSQALERVRQAAKQRRKERFTALFHHINSAMLRTAFFALKRGRGCRYRSRRAARCGRDCGSAS